MSSGLPDAVATGILLPASFLQSQFFVVLAAFVAINTVVYGVLAVSKVLPKVYLSDWVGGREHRSETRSIYPDGTTISMVLHPGAHLPKEFGHRRRHARHRAR